MRLQTVRGMRDYLPEQAKKKQFIEGVCRRVFEKYGFEPLETPIVEDFALLSAKGSAGEAIRGEIYYFRDKSERELGLRFDLTVPLARIVAANPSLQKPFKRYAIGRVYRYDRPQANRYREFTQADIDIIGSESVLADFECIQVAAEVLNALGLEFSIRVNNRSLLQELAFKNGVAPEKVAEAFRIIDKLEKVGEKEARKEFRKNNLTESFLDDISANSLEAIKEKIGEDSQGFAELEKLLSLARENKVGKVVFDAGLARGLEYYTGNVFEISLKEGPSVGGGGRYDRLVSTYGGQETAAVGISFGVDRLLDVVADTLMVGASAEVFVAPVSGESESKAMNFAAGLRKAGAAVESGIMGRNIRKNIEYATKKGIGFFTVIGAEEAKSGKVKVKNLSTREEKEFAIKDFAGIAGFVKE